MAVAYVSGSVATSGATSIEPNVPAPATITADNLLVALVYSATSGAPTPPAGWTTVATSTAANGSGQMTVLTKTATSAEPSSYRFAGAQYQATVIHQYSGTTGLDGAPVFVAVGASSATNSTGQPTASQAGDMLVIGYGSDGGRTWSAPAGLTPRQSAQTSNYQGQRSFDAAQAAAGKVPSYSATQTGTIFGSTSVALLLAPAGGGTEPEVHTTTGTATARASSSAVTARAPEVHTSSGTGAGRAAASSASSSTRTRVDTAGARAGASAVSAATETRATTGTAIAGAAASGVTTTSRARIATATAQTRAGFTAEAIRTAVATATARAAATGSPVGVRALTGEAIARATASALTRLVGPARDITVTWGRATTRTLTATATGRRLAAQATTRTLTARRTE